MFKIGDKVRCLGDTPGIWGKVVAVSGNYCTVRWNDGMRFDVIDSLLVKV